MLSEKFHSKILFNILCKTFWIKTQFLTAEGRSCSTDPSKAFENVTETLKTSVQQRQKSLSDEKGSARNVQNKYSTHFKTGPK